LLSVFFNRLLDAFHLLLPTIILARISEILLV
jgi:hypothetical protein